MPTTDDEHATELYRGGATLLQAQVNRFGLPLMAAIMAVPMRGAGLAMLFMVPPLLGLWALTLVRAQSYVAIKHDTLIVRNGVAPETHFPIDQVVVMDGSLAGWLPGALVVACRDGRGTRCHGLGRRSLPIGRNDLPKFKADLEALGGEVRPGVLDWTKDPSTILI